MPSTNVNSKCGSVLPTLCPTWIGGVGVGVGAGAGAVVAIGIGVSCGVDVAAGKGVWKEVATRVGVGSGVGGDVGEGVASRTLGIAAGDLSAGSGSWPPHATNTVPKIMRVPTIQEFIFCPRLTKPIRELTGPAPTSFVGHGPWDSFPELLHLHPEVRQPP